MASAATAATSGLSSWRKRENTERVERRQDDRTQRVGQRQHRQLERLWRRVDGNGDAQRGGRALLEPEIVRDRATPQRRDRRAMLGELDDRSNHDLRLVGGAEADEPTVIGAVGV